jgi:phospholipid transport system substrate-binding protein
MAIPAQAADQVAPAPAKSAQASDVVKIFYAQLTDVMKQGDQLGFAGRYKKLDPVLHKAFNLPLMTRFAVGLVWNDTSPAEQQQITTAFSSFSVATYASRFARYDGEQFSVTGEKPVPDGKIVETTLKPKTGDAVALNYLMRQDEQGNWRIVDVFLNGAISELATRRAEFSSVIKRDGIGALVNSLDAKSKQMGPT